MLRWVFYVVLKFLWLQDCVHNKYNILVLKRHLSQKCLISNHKHWINMLFSINRNIFLDLLGAGNVTSMCTSWYFWIIFSVYGDFDKSFDKATSTLVLVLLCEFNANYLVYRVLNGTWHARKGLTSIVGCLHADNEFIILVCLLSFFFLY